MDPDPLAFGLATMQQPALGFKTEHDRPFVRYGADVTHYSALPKLSGLVPGSLKVTGASNEPSSNPNNPEIVITPNGSGGFIVQLQADRLGSGNGRIYTLNATAMDSAGSTATATATCTVPRDIGAN